MKVTASLTEPCPWPTALLNVQLRGQTELLHRTIFDNKNDPTLAKQGTFFARVGPFLADNSGPGGTFFDNKNGPWDQNCPCNVGPRTDFDMTGLNRSESQRSIHATDSSVSTVRHCHV